MEDLGGSGRTVLFVSHNMQAVQQLCDRALLIEGGQIVAEGDPTDVVTTYLRSAHGSGSRVEWRDIEAAPGDELVKLRSVRVVDEEGNGLDTTDVRRPVGIEIAWRVLRDGPAVFPKVKLYDRHGDIAFNALDTSSQWADPSPPGDYVGTAWIPPNLLNEGNTRVDVAVCSLHAPKLYQHAAAYDAVGFFVFDPGVGDSARGTFVGDLRGAVRPLLDWSSERLD
jgi:lipopolysaccharide transport system ATP-binding protein